ncbi:MAG: Transcriptional regulator, LysR family [Labilithrix sp.]|nr:Transcriptional regulator, LysR family [Labilithrix sp.]
MCAVTTLPTSARASSQFCVARKNGRSPYTRAVDSFTQLEAFTRVVTARSFSRAAEQLGVTPSSVSRAVAALEKRLGVRLLNRTTRSSSVTDEGAAFYTRAMAILADLHDAERSVARARAAPRGKLRVDAPLALGEQVLAPALPEFLRRYPDVSLDLSLRDQYIDPVGEGIDVTLRMGKLAASDLVARKLGRVRLVVAGAPAYLSRYGRPTTPDDLRSHKCLTYLLRGHPIPWRFRRPDGATFVTAVNSQLSAASGEVLRRAAVAGAGLVYLFEYSVIAHVAAGLLEVVLADHVLPAVPVYAMHTQARHPALKIRAFVDFAAQLFRRSPYAG